MHNTKTFFLFTSLILVLINYTKSHRNGEKMALSIDKFIEQIIKNLEMNGFPLKKISFDLERLYEMADKHGLSFNNVAERLLEIGIHTENTTDKIVFSKVEKQPDTATDFEDKFEFPDMNSDTFKQAQEMLSKMSPEEMESMKNMFENMSDADKAEMMKKAKDLGIK